MENQRSVDSSKHYFPCLVHSSSSVTGIRNKMFNWKIGIGHHELVEVPGSAGCCHSLVCGIGRALHHFREFVIFNPNLVYVEYAIACQHAVSRVSRSKLDLQPRELACIWNRWADGRDIGKTIFAKHAGFKIFEELQAHHCQTCLSSPTRPNPIHCRPDLDLMPSNLI